MYDQIIWKDQHSSFIKVRKSVMFHSVHVFDYKYLKQIILCSKYFHFMSLQRVNLDINFVKDSKWSFVKPYNMLLLEMLSTQYVVSRVCILHVRCWQTDSYQLEVSGNCCKNQINLDTSPYLTWIWLRVHKLLVIWALSSSSTHCIHQMQLLMPIGIFKLYNVCLLLTFIFIDFPPHNFVWYLFLWRAFWKFFLRINEKKNSVVYIISKLSS